MRKKAIAIGVLLFVIVLSLIVARDPATTSDIRIVQNVRPFSWQVMPFGKAIPNTELRRYSVQMSFDEAVIATRRELPGWAANIRYCDAWMRSPSGKEYVKIDRGRMVRLNLREGSTMSDPEAAVKAAVNGPMPNAHGWVTITTLRLINAPSGVLGKVRKAIGGKRGFSYAVLTPLPITGAYSQPVRVEAGTANLEGSADSIGVFYAAE